MNDYRRAQTRSRCYRDPNRILQWIGGALIAAGLLLLFLCIPGWAWAAIAGATLICLGWALISTCRR